MSNLLDVRYLNIAGYISLRKHWTKRSYPSYDGMIEALVTYCSTRPPLMGIVLTDTKAKK